MVFASRFLCFDLGNIGSACELPEPDAAEEEAAFRRALRRSMRLLSFAEFDVVWAAVSELVEPRNGTGGWPGNLWNQKLCEYLGKWICILRRKRTCSSNTQTLNPLRPVIIFA